MKSPLIGRWSGLERPWPPALRMVAAGVAGWAAIRWGVTEPVPWWAVWSASAVSAAAGLASPAVARGAGPRVVAAWAAASAGGLYLGVPETDHVVGMGAVLAVVLLMSFVGPQQASWMLGAALVVVLVWAATRGAPAGGPALAAGMAMPGLLVVAPLTSHLPGPRHPFVAAAVQPAALVGLQAAFAVVLSRVAARSETIGTATAIMIAAVVVLLLATRLAVGSRSW